MISVIAIIGRPNVGKSTLFNCLTQSRDALVADLPGLTRDRQYGEGCYEHRRFIVIDTGGMGHGGHGVDHLTLEQTRQAIHEADVLLFVVDGRSGRTAADEALAAQLRGTNKKLFLVVNKIDGIDPHIAMAEFHAMGLGEPIAISAEHRTNISGLMSRVLHQLRAADHEAPTEEQPSGIQVAIIGRPNVGKSTLVNRILGEERVVVFDEPGTTRDSIYIPFERQGERYTIIDTAGMRRRSRIIEKVEKFSVTKSLQAIESANVVVFVIDAQENIVDHDLRLLGFVLDTGKALVIAVNKWDGLSHEHKQHIKSELLRKLRFIDFADILFISGLHGTGVGDLFKSINKAYQSATKMFSANQATTILTAAVEQFQPPLVRGIRVKLRYAHVGGHNPPVIVIHGNQTNALPLSYKRYLEKSFRTALKLKGTPVKLIFKTGENPFKGKKNELTDRQIQKRRRLKQYVRKKN